MTKQNPDNKVTVDEEILKTHLQSSDRKNFDIKPLLKAVREIFNPPIQCLENKYADLDSENNYEATKARGVFDHLSEKINKIGEEISKKCTEEGHGATISILKELSDYSWCSKLAIGLAAFSMNYAEFWFLQHGCLGSNENLEIAKSIACLTRLSIDDLKKSEKGLTEMKEVIDLCLDIADKIVELQELQEKESNVTDINQEIEQAKIYFAVYSTIMSILVCASQIRSLEMGKIVSSDKDMGNEKLRRILDELRKKGKNCSKISDQEKHKEYWRKLKDLFEKENNDNMDSLKALILTKNNEKPLIIKENKQDIDVLRDKNVLLLISDLEIMEQEITVLSEKLQHPQTSNQIVWLPIIDNWKKKEAVYKQLCDKMPWKSVFYPSLTDSRPMIEFIKKEWSFENKKPMLVVINSKGKLVCHNALHMLWIWGNEASPFNSEKEKELWSKASWKLKLLVNGIDPTVSRWIEEKKYICLYGGVDKDWIRNFTNNAKKVAKAADIPLEMVYVGKSNPKGRVDETIRIIDENKHSHRIEKKNFIWFFWVRIASMWYSKLQLNKTAGDDPIMKRIMRMLSLDSEPSWAVLGLTGGTNEEDLIVEAKGNIFLSCLDRYDEWKKKAEEEGFMSALTKELDQKNLDRHCNQLMLPSEEGKPRDPINCLDCDKPMDRVTLYKCCD